ncbi:MAG: polysaccharide biosynthesis protein [Actinobacteria bacterium]|nr:polysaccharide biosynthesis protein [Actinomycetota bacterium]
MPGSFELQERALLLVRRSARFATPFRILLDVLAWALAAALAIYLRFNLTFSDENSSGFWRILPLVAGLQIAAGFAVGIYRRRWRYGSYDEVAGLVLTAAITTGGLFLINRSLSDRPIPQSAVLVGGAFGLMMMGGIRYVWRLVLEWMRKPTDRTAERLIVFGAGEGGLQVITVLLRSRSSPYVPVALIDDDPAKQRLSITGVPVMGDRTSMAEIAELTDAHTLLIALPSASARTITEIAELAQAAGLAVKVLPPNNELFEDAVAVSDIRDLSEADLLGRHQIETNLDEIASYLRGKRVLVTGAGGSIGSEICRQLARFNPSELMMLDRDESALHQVQLSIHGRALLDTPETLLADIRDVENLMDLFRDRRPQVVFHAAALKHLPLLEAYPAEAFKSNVVGTLNVLRAAECVGVEVFVNISTDKAANPCSVLGFSKRVAERLTAHFAATASSGTYLSVRFGNVLGSRGSMLHTFRDQVANGGPVTVTHPDVTRFFMTIPESVQLVIQAGAIGSSGEVLVLDMGDPVRIYDVALRLTARADPPVEIVFTGLRPGEKLHEELFGDDEVDERPRHKLISHAAVPPLDPRQIPVAQTDVRSWMAANCSAVA